MSHRKLYIFLVCIKDMGRKEDVNMLMVHNKKTCKAVEMWRDALEKDIGDIF